LIAVNNNIPPINALNIFIEYSMKTLHQICLYYFVLLYFDLESISYILYIFSSIYTHEI
jgi:hypothetical protein